MTEPKSVDELLKQRARLDAELERFQRLVTVMFTDIAGSTKYFDEHGDLAGMAMVQECNDCLAPLVKKHSGTIVKTIGDAIMAYWDNPVQAVRCGIAMQRGIVEVNKNRSAAQQIRIRVALNLGVGLLKDNDVFGDVVNVASRIEHETEATRIGVSPSVVESISKEKDLQCRKIGTVELRGKSGKLDLYEVLWREGEKVEAPQPAKMSGEQLALATGTRLGLDDEVRKAIANAVKGKVSETKAGVVEKKKYALIEVLPDRSLGKRYPLKSETVVVGREKGDITFPEDTLLSHEHAAFTTLGGALYVEDRASVNGTFVRLRAPHTLVDDDIILLGRQMFRFHTMVIEQSPKPPAKDAKIDKAHTEKKEEPKKPAPPLAASPPPPGTASGYIADLFRLKQGGQEEMRFPLPRGETVLGRVQGTYTFPDDRYLSRTHARFRIHVGNNTLEDLKSTNGTFVRIRERHLLDEDDTVLIGSQFLRVVRDAG
ncbi:MAG: adenylate/guanylate cyclase domain-containing protein [Candidatus Acidiferrales bacterium]